MSTDTDDVPTANEYQPPSPEERGRSFATAAAIANGNDPPEIDDNRARELGRVIGNSPAAQRTLRGGGRRSVGKTHNGQRNIWETLGYPELGDVDAEYYLERYRRQDIARAIVTKPVESTWKGYPEIRAGGKREDDTQFEKDVQHLLDGETLERSLLHYCEWADRRQRIGEYGIIVLGLDDGRSLDQPVNEENISEPSDLQYLSPYSQAEVVDWELAELNSTERQPGLPLTYEIQPSTPNASDQDPEEDDEREVHYSRIIHLAEQPERSILKHTPPLEPVLNRLIDLEKVAGAAAEMYWTGADRKFFATAEGSMNDEDVERFDRQMWEMINGMRTTAAAENMDLEVIEGDSVDPSGIIDSLIKFIAASVGIPQRKLFGTERGELASTIDQETWISQIQERRRQFAEPVIIRNLIDRLQKVGCIEAPPEGEYTVKWPTLYESDQEEESTVHKKEMQAFKDAENAIALGAPRDLVYDRLGYDPQKTDVSGSGSTSGGSSSDSGAGSGSGSGSDTSEPDGATPASASSSADTPTNQTRDPIDRALDYEANLEDRAVSTEATDLERDKPTAEDLATHFGANANQYSEGDIVATPDGVGVVLATLEDDFEFPTGDDELSDVSASSDSPAYVVALAPGGSAPYRASSLESTSFDADDQPDPDGEALAEIVAENPDAFNYPEGWDRQSLIKYWSSIGGDWESCVTDLEDTDEFSEERAKRQCSSMKDELVGSERWRNRF